MKTELESGHPGSILMTSENDIERQALLELYSKYTFVTQIDKVDGNIRISIMTYGR